MRGNLTEVTRIEKKREDEREQWFIWGQSLSRGGKERHRKRKNRRKEHAWPVTAARRLTIKKDHAIGGGVAEKGRKRRCTP